MMAQYDNELRGVLFKNDKKEGNAKAPDYKGSATVDGEDYLLSAWIKEGKGGKFMSLAFKLKDGAAVGKNQTGKAKVADLDDDGERPF
jgi:hypothetical protein